MSKRTLNPNRLESLVRGFGYTLGYVSNQSGSFSLTRRRSDSLYELISCDFAGRHREAAICRIGASITRLVHIKDLTKKIVLLDVASDSVRGWTVLTTFDSLLSWEKEVARCAVPAATAFADEHAMDLLTTTSQTRALAASCLSQICGSESIVEAYAIAAQGASGTERNLASRLSEWPGVQQIANAEFEYELACLMVVRFIRNGRLPNPKDAREMPLEDPRLMWEIQILADRLLDRFSAGSGAIGDQQPI